MVTALAALTIVAGDEHKSWNVEMAFKTASELAKVAKDQLTFEAHNLRHGQADTSPGQVREDQVILATFDGAEGTTYRWSDMNDPVMGGQSHSSFVVADSAGEFKGTCAIVPFLKAPGFCKIATQRSFFHAPHFADVSHFADGALYLDVQTTTPEYEGFMVSFGAKNATRPPGAMHHEPPTFKAGFKVSGTERTTVKVPFSSFSVDWSDFTGRCDTKDPGSGFQHSCCGAEHPEVCPTAQHLAQITGLELWAEGIEGDFDLKVFSIGAGPAERSINI